MKATLWLLAVTAGVGALLSFLGAARAQLLITGNDEKVSFDENTGRTINRPPGKDTVSIIDIHDPTKPRIVANLPLMNTIIGPPVNLAITPDQHLALVANSLDWVKDGEGWKGVPDSKIYVIDLTAPPPAQIGTVEAGKQASGWQSTGLVRLRWSPTVPTIQSPCWRSTAKPSNPRARSRSPPSRHQRSRRRHRPGQSPSQLPPTESALSSQRAGPTGWGYSRLTVRRSATLRKNYDMATGLNPLNIEITPDGKLAIVNNIGGGQDGQVDTVGIIDLDANPPRVIDQVVVGDGPEGLGDEPGGQLCGLTDLER